MCLQTVDFAMEWSEDLQQYVGYGYKNKFYQPEDMNKWLSASGTLYKKPEDGSTMFGEHKILNICSGFGEKYPAGFHIFLKEDDARNYIKYGAVYKVAFTNVIAYGKNYTHTAITNSMYSPGKNMFGDCIIAQYMWVYPEVL